MKDKNKLKEVNEIYLDNILGNKENINKNIDENRFNQENKDAVIPILFTNQKKSNKNFTKIKNKENISDSKNTKEIWNKTKSKNRTRAKRNNKKRNINTILIIGEKENNKTKFNNCLKLSQIDEELQDMDYEEAITKDKRSYLKMYWSALVDSQIILGIIFTENNLNLLVIKISFFISIFQISFFLNALFYTDEYISDAYHNNGVLDFVSGLPKSIYSFLATLILTNLL